MRINRFIGALTEAVPDVTAEEIADALWLAGQFPRGRPATRRHESGPGAVTAPGGTAGPDRGDHAAQPWADRAADRLAGGSASPDPAVPADGDAWSGVYARAGRVDHGQGILSPRAAAMPRQLELARALRVLKRTVASRTQVILDEQATAEKVAHEGLWLPVLHAAPARWLNIALVIDDSPSMAIWRDTVADFKKMLELTGAFGDVRVWWLNTDAHTGDPFMLRSDGHPDQTMARSPWELPDPARRRLILVVSDGIGRAWRDRRVSRLLERWGNVGHVSILQPLPQRMWQRCAPAVAAVQVRAPEAAMENRRFSVRYRHVSDPGRGYRHPYGQQPSADDGVPIPVLRLDPRWLARWAQLVVGIDDWADVPVMFTRRVAQSGWDPARTATALDRVTQFRVHASGEAFQLAGFLAFAPLTPPVMRLVQQAVLPAAETTHLAEVLLGGLLVRAHPPEGLSGGEDAAVLYEFQPGVRELLRSTVPRSTGLSVLRQVSRFVLERMGSPVDFPALLDAPNRADLVTLAQLNRPFAVVARSALRGLGGRYADIADQLGEVLEPLPGLPSLTAEPAAVLAAQASAGQASARPRPAKPPAGPGDEPRISAQPPSRGDEVSHPPSDRRGREWRGELPAIWLGIPPRNPYFTGREDLLRDIHERLTSKVTALVPHALRGHGGVGKTHLAIEYIYRYQAEYDLVCWISSEQPAMVRTTIADLAKRMDLQSLDIDDAVRSVLAALRLGQPYDRWLLVFDNANRPEDIEEFFPPGSGHILLTSRNTVWGGSAQVIEVNVFQREESIDFLRGRLGEVVLEDADQLARRLDDLPLALEQAAAWQIETRTPVHAYLRLFDERLARLRDVEAVSQQVRPTDYPLPVAVTWSLALDRLREGQPEVVELLQLCAFFAPEPIPWNLLAVGRLVPSLPARLRTAISGNRDRDRMIREIKKYALAQVDYGSNRLQLHRLAQMVLREQLADDDERAEVRHQAHMLIAAADPGDPDVPDNWDRYRELWPHMEPSGSMRCVEQEVRELVLNLTRYLYVQGSYEAGRSFAETTLRYWKETFPPDDQGVLTLLRLIATILRALGQVDKARDRSIDCYEKLRSAYGEDDEEALSAGNVVGATYRDLGKFREALELDEDLHARHREVFGDEHPRTLMSANNHALDHFLMGDYSRAIDLDAKVLQVRRQVLGDTNPFTLCSEYSYARDLREAGQYWQARNQLEDTLGRYTATLGVIHPDTLRAAKHLAVARRKAGDYDSARSLSEQTFAAYQSRLGAGHPDTLSAAQNLVNDLRLTRDFDAAAQLAAETLQGYRRVLGPNHPFTLSAENNYAIVLRQSGRIEDACELSQHAFTGFSDALGPTHPYTLSAATTYANDLHATGDYPAALALLEATYVSFKEVLGKLHPYTLACGVNLIEELHSTGHEEGATLLADAVKERYAEVLGEEHPEVVAGRTLGVRGECSTDAPHT
ncbi:MAG: FxSxx-COOH system tetratricopeptide repeat protein [Streptosporangiaceae bacterium]|jgi:tetratricopeptide (TPR) repeat protein